MKMHYSSVNHKSSNCFSLYYADPICIDEIQVLFYYDNLLGRLPNIDGFAFSINDLDPRPPFFGYWSLDGHIIGLALYQKGLKTLPECISQLKSLKYFYLIGNVLTTLPECIGDLLALQALYLEQNRLISLPESIGKCTNLERLYLAENQLSTLPELIGKCIHLERLFLSANPLQYLPESLLDLSIETRDQIPRHDIGCLFRFEITHPLDPFWATINTVNWWSELNHIRSWTPDSLIAKIVANQPLDLIDKYHPRLGQYLDYIQKKTKEIQNETCAQFRQIVYSRFRIPLENTKEYQILL